ncbi:MAG: hypothetical protein GX924_07660 [Clostridiaceae bacterium]|nr:hypothetical protein [Clostridiaceae bacterium]
MIHETIKTLLGEDLTKSVEEALKGKGKDGKDVDLVVGNDGSYVPSTKYDQLKTEKAASDKLATDVQAQLTALKATDPEKLKTDLAAAQAEAENLKAKHAAEIKELQLDAALDAAIHAVKGRNPKAIKALLNRETLKLKDDGKVEGLNLDDIRKSDPYLFESDEDPAEPKFFGLTPGGQADTLQGSKGMEQQVSDIMKGYI